MPDEKNNQPLGESISEIIDRTTAIVHEEIELAKTEISVSLQNLLRGSVAGIVGGVFAFFGLFVLLIGLSFLIGDAIGEFYPWLGFLIVALLLFIFGGILALIALKKIKKGSQLLPEQAIDEAIKTREVFTGDQQEIEGTAVEEGASIAATTDGPVAAAQAAATPAEAFTPPPPAPMPEIDSKEAKRLAKQQARAAKEAEKAAAQAQKDAAKAEAAAAKEAAKAQKAADKAAKKAAKKGGDEPAPPPAAPPPSQPMQPPAPPTGNEPPAPPTDPSQSNDPNEGK